MFNVNIFGVRALKSEIHELYHRKNCKKKNRCFCNHSVVTIKMKACLLSKMSIFNLRGRGLKKEKMARGGGGGGGGGVIIRGRRLIEGRLLFEEIRYLQIRFRVPR